MSDRTATVFEIREFTLHDGPGARVTVFLKGCPLDCVWCHNPEGKSPAPQLMIKKSVYREKFTTYRTPRSEQSLNTSLTR